MQFLKDRVKHSKLALTITVFDQIKVNDYEQIMKNRLKDVCSVAELLIHAETSKQGELEGSCTRRKNRKIDEKSI